MEFVRSTKGNDNFLFEQTAVYDDKISVQSSKRTHKSYLKSNLTIVCQLKIFLVWSLQISYIFSWQNVTGIKNCSQ